MEPAMNAQVHKSHETLFLYALPESPLPDEEWGEVNLHLYSCPACMEKADYFMRMDDSFPEEVDENGELLPPQGWGKSDNVIPLRAAASTPGSATAVDRTDAGSTVFCTIGDVEIRRLPGDPICLYLTDTDLAEQTIRIFNAEGTVLAFEVDSFRRLSTSGEDLAELMRWVGEGAELRIEIA
ncbi:hypothetical protein JYT83_00285 [bacterium AH-315-F18]|nr:hypothetical protein [bacterium AH-315-F18]